MAECENCRRLAVKVLNLRRALFVANNLLAQAGNTLLVGVNEDAGPTFRGGRTFWSRVRRLIEPSTFIINEQGREAAKK